MTQSTQERHKICFAVQETNQSHQYVSTTTEFWEGHASRILPCNDIMVYS